MISICKYSKIQTILFQCKASYRRKRLRPNYQFQQSIIADICKRPDSVQRGKVAPFPKYLFRILILFPLAAEIKQVTCHRQRSSDETDHESDDLRYHSSPRTDVELMEDLHHLRSLRHKFQTEAQACYGEKHQPKECPPAKTDMKVEQAALASLAPLHLEALTQLLAVLGQEYEYSAYQYKDKQQCGVGDNNLAHRSHHESGVEFGDIGEEVSLCSSTVWCILGRRLGLQCVLALCHILILYRRFFLGYRCVLTNYVILCRR